jgi:hypothetical protein
MVGGVSRVLTINPWEGASIVEPYEDYVPDDLLRLEIRETVAAPPTTFVLPAAGWIGRPMQRTVKASGQLIAHP